jgi:hypothetical protein
MKQPHLLLRHDAELSKKLRQEFTAKACIEALMEAVATIANSIGVTITWTITTINPDKNVNKEDLTLAIGRVATTIGAILAGSQVNPLATKKDDCECK